MRARLLACLAQELYFVAGSNERRHELSSEGVEMARRLGDPATLVHALLARNLAVLGPATAAERLAYATEAGALAISLGERQLEGHSAFHRFTAFAELDDMPAASVEQDRCLTLLGELRDPVEALARPAYEAGVATLEGRFADANRLIHLAFQRGQEARDPNALVFFASGITPLRYFQGRSEELLAVAEEFRDAFPLLNPAVCCMLAGFNAEVGRHEAARSCLAEYDIADYSEMAGGAMWSYAAHNLARACWRLGDAERSAALYDLLLPHADLNACVATLGWGSFQLPLAWCALTCGRLDDAAEHFEAALVAHARNGWLAALADTQLHFATMLASRDGSGDRERARALLDEVSVTATKLGMSAHLQQADDLRQAMIGVPAHAVARPVRTITRRERARAMLTARGRATVARWTRGDSDEDLVRRFGGDVAQRALFTGMTRSFQSVRAFGFSGDLVFELRPPEDELDPASSDWWTIEVHGRKASARRGRSAEAVSTIHIGLADFVRVTSGELSIATAILDGRLDIDGDVLLAARIPELFGASAPIEGLGHAAEG
jgi:tetratricopeptide (TPR) repeat protein